MRKTTRQYLRNSVRNHTQRGRQNIEDYGFAFGSRNVADTRTYQHLLAQIKKITK